MANAGKNFVLMQRSQCTEYQKKPILMFMFPSREIDSTLLLNASLAQNCFAHRGALFWNNLPKEISSAKFYDS